MTDSSRSSRARILDAALDLFRDHRAVSLDTVAKAVGLTKPGVMHYFPSKLKLMYGLVDHLFDSNEDQMLSLLPETGATVEDRLLAYSWWMIQGVDRADLIVFSDPRLSEELMARWSQRVAPWVEIPDDVSADRRVRLLAVRAAAEGMWFSGVTDMHPMSDEERAAVWAHMRALLDA